VHKFIEIVLFSGGVAGLTFWNAHGQPDGLAPVPDQFGVALLRGQLDGARGAEKSGEVYLQTARPLARGAGNGGHLVFGEDDGILRADPAARRAPAFAIVLALDQNFVGVISPVDAEEAEINALKAVGAARVINHRIPPLSARFTGDHKTLVVFPRDCELLKLRRPSAFLNQTGQRDEFDRGFLCNAPDLVDIDLRVIISAQVEAEDVAIWNGVGPDTVMILFLASRVFLVFLLAQTLQQGHSRLAFDPVAIKHPVRGPRVEPGEENDVSLHRTEI